VVGMDRSGSALGWYRGACAPVDRQLFRASTIVIIGNARKASFWKSSWLDGRVPMDIAPGLYKLSWRKNRKVRE